jgi:hypothetical protein
MKKELMLGIAIVFGSSTALAAGEAGGGLDDANQQASDSLNFSQWDNDQSGSIERNEFRTALEDRLWSRWDTNNSGMIDADQWSSSGLHSGIGITEEFAEWDANDDFGIDRGELAAGLWDNLDKDNSNVIEYAEYDDADEQGLFDV